MFAKKSLGQHFLMHRRIAERIADTAILAQTSTVLEIGPGTGMLTEPLLARAGKIIAVEADQELAAGLRETFAADILSGRLEIHTQDVRAFDPASIPGPYTLVANIPYYITGEIIRKFLETDHKPQSMTLLVQKEVAERIARAHKESLLSLSVKTYGTPHYDFTVPRGAFKPAPTVDSAVLSITDIKNPFANKEQEKLFFTILHAGFAHKRKKLAKNLAVSFSPDSITTAFAVNGIGSDVRAEDLQLLNWYTLATSLRPVTKFNK